jgi:hypothetical protein
MPYQRHAVNAAGGRTRVLFHEAWFRHADLVIWIRAGHRNPQDGGYLIQLVWILRRNEILHRKLGGG